MNIEVCKTVCKNCPFKKENAHKLYLDEVKRNFMNANYITPCHMVMVKYTGIENKGVELYAQQADVFKVCKGMVLSRFKSFAPSSPLYTELYVEALHDTSIDNIVEVDLCHS